MVKNLIMIIDDLGKKLEVEVLTYFQTLSGNQAYLIYNETNTGEDEPETIVGMISNIRNHLGIYAVPGKELDYINELVKKAINSDFIDDDIIILPIKDMPTIETMTYSTIELTNIEIDKFKTTKLGKVGIRKEGSGIAYDHNPYKEQKTTSIYEKEIEERDNDKTAKLLTKTIIDPLKQDILIPSSNIKEETSLPSLEEIENHVEPVINNIDYEEKLKEIKEVKKKISKVELKKTSKARRKFSRTFKTIFSSCFYIILFFGIFIFFETKINSIIPIKTKLECALIEKIDNEQEVKIVDIFNFFGKFTKRVRTHHYQFETKALYYQYQDLIDNYEEEEKLPGSILNKNFDNATLIYNTKEIIKKDQLSGTLKTEYENLKYNKIKDELLKKKYTCN